jgi:hypothetical protein
MMPHNTTNFVLSYYKMKFQCLNKIYVQKKTHILSESLEGLLF